MKIYVKKIYSLSPDKYKYINLDTVLKEYSKYLNAILDSYILLVDKRLPIGEVEKIKSVPEWLETEI